MVTKWLALGNMRLVSELCGVSYQLCRMWKQQPWWADLVAEIKSSRDIVVDNKLSKLVDRSLETIADRLDNGNIVWNRKTGSIENIPVSIAEATKVADVLLTQQLNLSKKKVVESQGDSQKTIKDQIANLALEFAKFNTNRTISVQARVVDAEIRSTETLGNSQQGEVSSLLESVEGAESHLPETDEFEDEVGGVFEDALSEESGEADQVYQFSPQGPG